MAQKPAHHLDSGKFQNPWPAKATFLDSLLAIVRIPLTRAQPFETLVEPAKTVPCDFELYQRQEEKLVNSICTTWLGHAGFLVQLPRSNGISRPTHILFDPIFAERASPSTWVGPKRYLDSPCKVEDLPGVDYVLISHNHYDHLDMACLIKVHKLWPEVQFLVPLGVKSTILGEIKVDESKVREMDWWDTVSFSNNEGSSSEPQTTIEFVCTPAEHNSGRGILDQKKSLWASWVVRQLSSPNRDSSSTSVASIYFAGDTGYATSAGPCPAFKEIGNKYGPFDLAMIPIWRGASLSMLGRLGFRLAPAATETLLSTLHASPSDAVSLSRDVRAKHAIAMHYGTFCGSEDEAKEPLVLLIEALRASGVNWIGKGGVRDGVGKDGEKEPDIWDQAGFGAVDVGQTVFIPV